MTEPASINPGLIDEARQFIAEKQPGFSLVGQLIDAIDRLRAVECEHGRNPLSCPDCHPQAQQPDPEYQPIDALGNPLSPSREDMLRMSEKLLGVAISPQPIDAEGQGKQP